MSCPDLETVAAFFDGGLSSETTAQVDAHVQTCATCEAQLRSMQMNTTRLRTMAERTSADPALVARIQARLRHARYTRKGMQWLTFAAASIALFVVSSGLWQRAPEFQGRGGIPSALKNKVGVQIFAQSKSAQTRPLHQNDKIAVGEGLSFLVRNRTGQPFSLMIFGIDRKGAVHWFYPSYQNADENPRSTTVAPTPIEQPLPEVVAPADAAPGTLRVVSIFTTTPLTVRAVESALRESQNNIHALEKSTLPVRFDVVELQWP